MKKHYTYILTILFFVFFTYKVAAQPYYTLPPWDSAGTYSVGNVNVGFTYSGIVGLGGCWGANWTAKNNGYFTFTFNVPVAGVRIYGIDWDPVEYSTNNIAVSINGSPYYLQTSNLSPYSFGNSCNAGSKTIQGSISGGNFINGCGTLTITEPGITSLKIQNSGNGSWGFRVEILPLFMTANTPCAGDTLNLTSDFAGLTSGVTYNWTGPNGFTSALKSPTINNASAAHSGLYTVTASNGTVTASQTQNAYVNPIPTVNTLNNQTLCNGSPVSAVNFSSPANLGTICGNANEGATLSMNAPPGAIFTNVQFASYGNATGSCGNFALGSCNASTSTTVVAAAALGNNSFSLAANNDTFGDPCNGTPKNLKVQLNYTTPITYSWTNNNTSIGLAASGIGNIPSFVATNTTHLPITATITVTPKYTNGGTACPGTPKTFNITVNPSPKITAQPTSGTICNGASTSFTATVSNGTTYQWQVNTGLGFTNITNVAPYSGATTSTLNINQATTSLNGHTYRLLASGNCGPALTSNIVTLTIPTLSATTVVDNVSCNGSATGSATVTVSGGTTPYSYSWNNGITSSTNTATNLEAGTYQVTITDANDCEITQDFTITEPSALSTTADQENVFCNGSATGSATITVSGGTTPYSYSWNNGITSSTNTATNLEAGTYEVTITDANDCEITGSFTITEPSALSSTADQENVLCNGSATGSATVIVSGGTTPYSYSWNNGIISTTNTATNLEAGTYQVTITDVNDCEIIQDFTITEPSALSNTAEQDNVLCNGLATGSATVTVSGGTTPYSYSWNNGITSTTNTATNLQAGTYQVSIIDANDCEITHNFTITEPSALTSTAEQDNVLCNGLATGSATVTVSGGTTPYSYSWNNGITSITNTANNLESGTYQVTITDANDCAITQNFTITEPSALSNTAEQENVLCNGSATGSATVTVSGGTIPYSYSWNNGITSTTNTASNLEAGTYQVTITDANDCEIIQDFTITKPSALSNTAEQDNVLCNGSATGSATVIVSGGTTPYSYSWNNGITSTTNTANNLEAGTYQVTITDAKSCTISETFEITAPTTLLASAGIQENASSFGESDGSATVNVTGGTAPYSYSWNTNPIQTTATASDLAAGTYSVTVTDANLCETTQSFIITAPDEELGVTTPGDNKESAITVYPNPAATEVFINIPDFDSHKNLTITLHDLTGKIVKNQELIKSKPHRIDITGLESSVYIITIISDTERIYRKIIVQ